jgi:uncharacterized protein YbaR (Trm112 family)
MLDPDLLSLLRCPETHQTLMLAPAALVDSMNARVAQGTLKNRAGNPVTEKFESGLLRSDGQYLYLVRNNIPIMLVEEAIPAA